MKMEEENAKRERKRLAWSRTLKFGAVCRLFCSRVAGRSIMKASTWKFIFSTKNDYKYIHSMEIFLLSFLDRFINAQAAKALKI